MSESGVRLFLDLLSRNAKRRPAHDETEEDTRNRQTTTTTAASASPGALDKIKEARPGYCETSITCFFLISENGACYLNPPPPFYRLKRAKAGLWSRPRLGGGKLGRAAVTLGPKPGARFRAERLCAQGLVQPLDDEVRAIERRLANDEVERVQQLASVFALLPAHDELNQGAMLEIAVVRKRPACRPPRQTDSLRHDARRKRRSVSVHGGVAVFQGPRIERLGIEVLPNRFPSAAQR